MLTADSCIVFRHCLFVDQWANHRRVTIRSKYIQGKLQTLEGNYSLRPVAAGAEGADACSEVDGPGWCGVCCWVPTAIDGITPAATSAD